METASCYYSRVGEGEEHVIGVNSSESSGTESVAVYKRTVKRTPAPGKGRRAEDDEAASAVYVAEASEGTSGKRPAVCAVGEAESYTGVGDTDGVRRGAH